MNIVKSESDNFLRIAASTKIKNFFVKDFLLSGCKKKPVLFDGENGQIAKQ